MLQKTTTELTLLLLAGTLVAAGCQRVTTNSSGSASGAATGTAAAKATTAKQIAAKSPGKIPGKIPGTIPGKIPGTRPGAGGRIACDNATFNFGKVVQGKSVEHTFTIVNRGKELLHIERARGG